LLDLALEHDDPQGVAAVLQSLTLNNFRCFSEHEIHFGAVNIAVGLNNAGKTTVAEALRILSVATSRLRNLDYHPPPNWLFVPKTLAGCKVSLQNLQINFESLFHRYEAPPAVIEANFGKRGRLRVYVAGEKKTHCVVYDGIGRVVKTRESARKSQLPRLETLPQVGPVAAEERILTSDYVRGALSSRLAPIHFRNQLNLLFDLFPAFQQSVEDTWAGLRVVELIGQGKYPNDELHLEVRDGDFVGEIGIMGHGLQMWLQTMWFLTRTRGVDTVILDEPDVYMHADLQRRLVRYVRGLYPQVIITTHSTEIMSEVAPEEIIVIDKGHRESKRADSLPAVQKVVSALGSAHNVHLARLWSAKKVLLVEGNDLRLLKVLQNTVLPKSLFPLDGVPNTSFGGWGGWRNALGSPIALKNAAGASIRVYCILDSDYHIVSQVQELHSEFERYGGLLHIWEKKEIENYLLVPEAILRAISARAAKRTKLPDSGEIRDVLGQFAQELENEVLDATAHECLSANRSLGVAGANREAREFIRSKVEHYGVLGTVSGKTVLRKLFTWTQDQFGVSLSALALAVHLSNDEIDPEMKSILLAIEECRPFPAQRFISWEQNI
jgi:energy-coupling factor transporter ATP-binding protein EcfA2